ncbi:MAG TPA: class I SAM-dependent methyltransferase [Ktedonobacterales bacterium]|nr:class I SAM-dependent methyltransferase [Ktedonobacterales bacterium]
MAATKRASLHWRIVRTLFEMLYRNRTLYWLASTIPFAGQWRRWQRLVLPRIVGNDVLEIGCGIGTLLADMLEAGYTCTAIERSPQMIAATRAELRRRGFSGAQDIVRHGSAQRLPFADASFDTVVSTFPTEYIYDRATLAEIARVLRPGGRLVVVLGAALLPANTLLLPFVAVQTLVYGRTAPSRASDSIGSTAPSDPLSPLLARAGLVPRGERVRGPFWIAHLVVAEKPVSPQNPTEN